MDYFYILMAGIAGFAAASVFAERLYWEHRLHLLRRRLSQGQLSSQELLNVRLSIAVIRGQTSRSKRLRHFCDELDKLAVRRTRIEMADTVCPRREKTAENRP